ncbi:MAG: decarboxylating 6-phosphogluconate dehydrogenase [Vicinamibacterales bacterium]
MQVGFVGLGKMGANMVTRLLRGGHAVVAFDRSPEAVARAVEAGAAAADSLETLVGQLATPRAVWVMVPAGAPTESTVAALGALLSPGDTIIDGGNTNFHDDVRRAEELSGRGIAYLDAGTSGGIWGLTEGYCLMVGGDAAACTRLEAIFTTLAPAGGYLHVGASGSGHYVKMVHNAIEYGLMQAYAEGFELMDRSSYGLDLPKIAALWMQGSVVRSWLLDLTARALAADPRLADLSGYVEDSGEGRWTLQEAIEQAVPMPALTASLFTRFRSREDNPFAERLLAALRQQFGGHAVKKAE